MTVSDNVRTVRPGAWWIAAVVAVAMVVQVTSLNGPNVCMVKQKYNVTKRVKYRAPMSVRTYEWCFSMPPRCSRWSTEMRDLTRLETEERTAEMAACCPGYKMRDVSCVPICPHGKTGHGCSEGCPPNKWGPNCVHECRRCDHGTCSPTTGECHCQEGWQGESCETIMSTTPAAMMEQLLTTGNTSSTKTTLVTTTQSTSSTSRVETSPVTSSGTPISSTKTTLSTLTTPIKIDTTIIERPTTVSLTEKPTIISETKKTVTYNNVTLSSHLSPLTVVPEDVTKRVAVNNSVYSTTGAPIETATKIHYVERYPIVRNVLTTDSTATTTEGSKTLSTAKTLTSSTALITTEPTSTGIKETATRKFESTRKPETTIRLPTTVKFKHKEIWIRPAQKGESPLVEIKFKTTQELPHLKYKNATKMEITPENTTPKTIIVSIIPTSVSYATFKKIALTTTSYISQMNNITVKSYNKTPGFTKPMSVHTTTATPYTIKISNTIPRKANVSSTVNPLLQNVTKISSTPSTITGTFKTTVSANKTTNSMSSTYSYEANKRLNSSNFLTTISISSTNVSKITPRPNVTKTIQRQTIPIKETTTLSPDKITEHPSISKQFVTVKQRNITDTPNITKTLVRKQVDTNSQRNLTNPNSKTNTVTEEPAMDEETFHILTEPEHITAVMGDKGSERSSVDLISVISIAGGLMMAVITVAVVIVMLERCKRPRYDDVRKYNDIRMQVMIDNNDVPPPYVRSIFHTPLPDPPTQEKCHYQPISTLDRNLKQFMRPVVVQTISPLMLENFRGILECHYDHLPRRSHDLENMHSRCSAPPSMNECQKLLHQRAHSITDSTIEALKCEAKLDVIDNTTSEPLYAEIPCWRPPSEHAIEIVNVNGEAVTEL